MTGTIRDRRRERRFALEREVAPHVEPEWAEAVLLELRIQGVGGDRIGEALSEVDSHCAESGESARDAFGDPLDYARSLNLPRDAAQSPAATFRAVWPVFVQLAGSLLVIWSVPALVTGEVVAITLGQALTAVLLALALVLLAARPEPALRAVVRRPVVSAVALAAGITALVLPFLLLRAELLTMPPALAGAIGLLVLAAGVLLELLDERRPGGDDSIRTPLQDAATTERRRRESRRARVVGLALVPGWTLAAGLLLWWLAS